MNHGIVKWVSALCVEPEPAVVGRGDHLWQQRVECNVGNLQQRTQLLAFSSDTAGQEQYHIVVTAQTIYNASSSDVIEIGKLILASRSDVSHAWRKSHPNWLLTINVAQEPSHTSVPYK